MRAKAEIIDDMKKSNSANDSVRIKWKFIKHCHQDDDSGAVIDGFAPQSKPVTGTTGTAPPYHKQRRVKHA